MKTKSKRGKNIYVFDFLLLSFAFLNSEETIIALNAELEAISAELARSEKSGKATQVNLSLQSVQHKREMADLRREVEALSSKPDLEEALVELENRNNEMEELLKAKCAEIEENDDRALE